MEAEAEYIQQISIDFLIDIKIRIENAANQ